MATKLARLGRAVTLPQTRRLIVATARSNELRRLARRAAADRGGIVRDLRHVGHPRDLIRNAARHPAARELAEVGLVFLPLRYVPLAWVAKWVTAKALRRYVDRGTETR